MQALPLTERDVRIMTACTRAFLAFFATHRELFVNDVPEPVSVSFTGDDNVAVTLTAPYGIVPFLDDDLDDDRYEPVPAAPSAPRVGRNEPCPCGSGKKYKKCHLDADQAPRRVTSEIETVHQMDFRLVKAVARFATSRFGPDWLAIDPDEDIDAVELILPWATWTATVGTTRVADAFFEENERRLSAEERDWFAAQRDAWLSIWEVMQVEPGIVHVRDLLTGQKRVVHEERASRSLVARDTMLARMIDYRGTSYFGGTHNRPLSPGNAVVVIDDVRKKLRVRKADVPVERLRYSKIGRFMIDCWSDIVGVRDEHYSVPPTMQNTDGDPLLFVTETFGFDSVNRAEIEKRLAAMEGLHEARAIGEGTELVFVRGADETVLARVVVMSDRLQIETNSDNRADAFGRRVRDACAGLLNESWRDTQSLSSVVPSDAPQPKPVPSEEERAMFRQIKEKHYRKWMDLPIPALEGQTPRAAARSAKSREKLELLLRELENRENHLPEDERFDIERLRSELGLAP
jgi:hypothetical protein